MRLLSSPHGEIVAASLLAVGLFALSSCVSSDDTPPETVGTPTSELVDDYLADLTERCEAQADPDVPNADPCLEIAEYNGARLSGVLFDYYVEHLKYPGDDVAALKQMQLHLGDGLTEDVSLAEYATAKGDNISDAVDICVVHLVSGAWAYYTNGSTTPDARGVDGATCEA